MIGAKAHKHHGYSVSDADPVGVSDASHSRKQMNISTLDTRSS